MLKIVQLFKKTSKYFVILYIGTRGTYVKYNVYKEFDFKACESTL